MNKDYYVESEYASDYFESVPVGYINKTVCGCGLTTVAIESDEDVIIAMPNVELIKNKVSQYPNDRCEYKILGIYGGISENDINAYCLYCADHCQPIKILVTYDSLWKCEEIFEDCRLIIDESDRILANTKLKLKGRKDVTEISCIDYLLGIAEDHKDTVSFISATPIPLEYLPEWISTIDQVTIEWANSLRIVPICMKRYKPLKCLKDEILKPLHSFDKVTINGTEFNSVIVFINSVSSIKKAIKDTGINTEDVGIICANNLRNDIKISGIKRIKDYSNLPKYSFVTSSGFQGMDLYSNNAMTVVVSTTGNDFQMIDMKTDLKQATSRQRVKSNPTYGKYIYIYNQSMFDVSKDEIVNNIDDKLKRLTGICSLMNKDKDAESNLSVVLKESATFNEYVNKVEGHYSINELSFNADKYFILETRDQYTKGFMVQNAIEGDMEDVAPIMIENVDYRDMVDYFASNNINGQIDWKDNYNPVYAYVIEQCFKKVGKTYKNYSTAYDIAYNVDKVNFQDIRSKIQNNISAGDYTRKDLKGKLQEVYNTNKINRKAEWKDIYEVYEDVKLITIHGKKFVRILSA